MRRANAIMVMMMTAAREAKLDDYDEEKVKTMGSGI